MFWDWNFCVKIVVVFTKLFHNPHGEQKNKEESRVSAQRACSIIADFNTLTLSNGAVKLAKIGAKFSEVIGINQNFKIFYRCECGACELKSTLGDGDPPPFFEDNGVSISSAT